MKCKYRLFQRRTGIFFVQNNETGRQESLRTRDKKTALRLFNARNEAHEQPAINLQIAKAYLAAADSTFIKRTWREVMAEFIKTKSGSNRTRSERATLDKSFDLIRDIQLIETRPEQFLKVLQGGKVSTNNYLRRFHNFALDMGWLPWPVLPKKRWPAIHYKAKRAITLDEHQKILAREKNPEMRAFLECCWHIGGSQSDMAHLKAEDIDWKDQVVSFFRAKTGTAQILHFGKTCAPLNPERRRKAKFDRGICGAIRLGGSGSLRRYRNGSGWGDGCRGIRNSRVGCRINIVGYRTVIIKVDNALIYFYPN